MDHRERAIRRIEQVLELEADPAVAYPLRARLGRAVFESVSWVGDRPGETGLNEQWLRDLKAHADRIMQPSEPFDGRWQQEWAVAIDGLKIIRAALLVGEADGR